ncbi:MAG TPA: twin-arginine translocation signal domain-containing protein, partial [Caulobacteraceae bacterium]|nr:twin-arginine translocation signal domain-containing protein [Caulobacteraceae bacterium]
MNAPVGDLKAARGLSRRQFVVASTLTAAGALVVGCSPADLLSVGAKKQDLGPFGPFIRIAPDDVITIVSKHIEFGQGNHA